MRQVEEFLFKAKLVTALGGIHVSNTKKDDVPLTLTTGLHLRGLPELIMIGVPPLDEIRLIFEEIIKFSVDNEIRDGDLIKGIANITPMVIDCSEENKKIYRPPNQVFYDSWDFELQQVIFSDLKGRFPWDDGCAEGVRDQPILKEIENV